MQRLLLEINRSTHSSQIRGQPAMLAMLSSLWALSVLLLQLGAQGARMASARELPPCQFYWQVPGSDCYGSPHIGTSNLAPCQFEYQIDCRPMKLSTPATKVSWYHCLKCLEILYTCGCIIADLLIAAPRPQTLNFYDVDSNVPTILAEHSTPTETKTMRLWKTGYGKKYTEALNMSSGLTACDPNKCIASLHNCWMCLGHEPPPGAGKAAIMSASYDFGTGLAPFYDVAVETSVETETVRLWKKGSSGYSKAVDLPVGHWRANFSLGEEYLEISFANGASDSVTQRGGLQDARYNGGRILPPCNFEHIRRGLDCLP